MPTERIGICDSGHADVPVLASSRQAIDATSSWPGRGGSSAKRTELRRPDQAQTRRYGESWARIGHDQALRAILTPQTERRRLSFPTRWEGPPQASAREPSVGLPQLPPLGLRSYDGFKNERISMITGRRPGPLLPQACSAVAVRGLDGPAGGGAPGTAGHDLAGDAPRNARHHPARQHEQRDPRDGLPSCRAALGGDYRPDPRPDRGIRPLPAVTFRETAIDYLVHGQDIAIPLGRTLPMPGRLAVLAAYGSGPAPGCSAPARSWPDTGSQPTTPRRPPGRAMRSPGRSARCRSYRARERRACASSSLPHRRRDQYHSCHRRSLRPGQAPLARPASPATSSRPCAARLAFQGVGVLPVRHRSAGTGLRSR